MGIRTHGGYEGPATYQFAGEVDEVSIWTVDQFNAAFTPPSTAYAGTEPGLLALYHLDGNGTDSVAPVSYTLSGPSSGTAGAASSAFTVQASGTLGAAVTVTPNDGGAGGTFSPATVSLAAGSNPSATFTYAASSAGTKTIATTNNGGLTNPAALTYTAGAAAATSYTLTGPSSGFVGSASANFTVQAVGALSGAVVVTPSDGGNGGTFSPATVTLATGTNSSATFTYTAVSAGSKSIATTNGGSLANPAAVPYSASAGSVTVAPNTAGIVYSRGNWLIGGAAAKTINAGAYLRTLFTGGSVTLNFDVSANSSPLPQLYYRIDGVVWTQATLGAALSLSMPASTVAWPRHSLELVVKSMSEWLNFGSNQGGSRWSPQNTAVVLTGIVLASGQSLSAPSGPSQSVLVFGDSITEGYHTVSAAGSGAQDTDGSDALIGWAYRQRELLGAEVGVIGFGGAGLLNGGVLGVPILSTSYGLLWSGQARSFSPAPDLVVIAYGENDGTSSGDSTFIGNYRAVLNGLLAATPPATLIACLVPFSQRKAADIATAIAGIGNPRVIRIDTTGMFSTTDSVDGQHPLGVANLGAIAPAVAGKLRPLLQGVRNRWVHA